MHRQPASALDLFTDSIRLLGDGTIVSVLEFDRRLDHGRVCMAVSKCFDAYPILSARLVRGNGPAYWELRTRNESFEEVPLIDIGSGDYRPFVVRGVDPYIAPQAVFRILRSQQRDVLVINMTHAAADAHGAKELSRTLMEAYLDPPSVRACEGGLPLRDTLWTTDLDNCSESLKKDGVELIDPMWPRPCGTSTAASNFHRVVIDPEGMDEIKKEAKARGGTINDVFMAAYFLSLSDLTGHMGPQRMFFPVNLRRYLNDGSRVMSNQAANVAFQLTRLPGEGMDQILDKVITETRLMKNDRIGIKEQTAFDRCSDPEGKAVHKMVQEMARLQNEGKADIFISNPGQIPMPTVPGLIDAYICYPGVYMPATCFVITSFRDSTTITIGYQDEEGPRTATMKALHGIVYHLPVDPSHVRFL